METLSKDFNGRITKEDKAKLRYEKYCLKNNLSFSKTGREELSQSDNYSERIKKVECPILKTYRYAPDYMIIDHNLLWWHVDVKHSYCIEANAYKQYIALNNLHVTSSNNKFNRKDFVKTVFLHKEDLHSYSCDKYIFYSCDVSNLKFELLKGTMHGGAPVRTVIINGEPASLVEPRKLPPDQYNVWKRKGASGTSYLIVDFFKTKFDILKED